MLFISNRPKYQFIVMATGGKWRKRSDDSDFYEVTDGYTAEFVNGCPGWALVAAREHWIGAQGNRLDGTIRGLGAHSLLSGQPIGADPFDPNNRFSMFDTDWIDDPDIKAEAERKLCDPQFNNNEHILVTPESVPEPWPGYDLMKGVRGRPVAEQIAQHAMATGTVGAALAYEAAVRKREPVIAALEAAHEEAVKQQIEDDALSAEVPA